MSGLGGKSSGGEARAYAHSGLGTGPGGGCCPSQMPQVASPQEGHATTQAGYPPQGVPWGKAETEQGKTFFCIHNSLILNKGLMYVNTTPKFETEEVLAFIIPVAQRHMVLNGVHRDAGHQGQRRTLALAQERFWWPMMTEDSRAIVRGCLHATHSREKCQGLPSVRFERMPHWNLCISITPA